MMRNSFGSSLTWLIRNKYLPNLTLFLVHPYPKTDSISINLWMTLFNLEKNVQFLNIWNSGIVELKITFLSFNEHLVFHKNWGQYNLYVRATLSNFQALRYVSNVDDYHTKFPTYHKIPALENPHFSKPRKQTEF